MRIWTLVGILFWLGIVATLVGLVVGVVSGDWLVALIGAATAGIAFLLGSFGPGVEIAERLVTPGDGDEMVGVREPRKPPPTDREAGAVAGHEPESRARAISPGQAGKSLREEQHAPEERQDAERGE